AVCRLGAAGRLVACTRYCTEPAAALAQIERIGGTKNPDCERIAALGPDLVLANREENRREDIDWLTARMPVLAQLPRTVPDAASAIAEAGRALDAADAAAALCRAIEAQLAAAGRRGPAVRAFYARWC